MCRCTFNIERYKYYTFSDKATREEFMALPRIGEILTGRILAYRRERGRFFSVYDLYQVEGMTESIFEEIEPLIFVGG